MLLGRAPRLRDIVPTLAVDAEAERLPGHLGAGGQSQQLWVDPGRRRVVRSQLTGPGGYGVDLRGLHGGPQVPFPRS